MKRLISIGITFVFFVSCESSILENKNEVEFLVLKDYPDNVESLEIQFVDGDISEAISLNDSKSFITFTSLDILETSIKSVNLRGLSEVGEGRLFATIYLENNVKLTNGIGYYKNFRLYTENAPKSWQTLEIVIPKDASQFYGRIAKYKDGKFVERF